jgi:hypothetical protein
MEQVKLKSTPFHKEMGPEISGPRGGSPTKAPLCDSDGPRVTLSLDALPGYPDQHNDNRSIRQEEGGSSGARRVRKPPPGEPARGGEGDEREGKRPESEEKEAFLVDDELARFLDGIF